MLSKKLFALAKENWSVFVLFVLFIAIFFQNFHYGTTIMGLDNASPWFGLNYLTNLVKSAPSFIEFGPLLFSPYLLLGYLFQFPSWAISQLVYWGCLLTGLVGFYALLPKEQSTKAIGVLLVLGSLATIWIFSQPTYLFMHSFAGIPWVIFSLTHEKQRILQLFVAFLGYLTFCVTLINPVAFFIYIIIIFFISYQLNPVRTKRRVFISIIAILMFWQFAISMFYQPNRVIPIDLHIYLTQQLQSKNNDIATKALRSAEISNNSFINTARFATGWMELNDLNINRLFNFKLLFQNNILVVIITSISIASSILFVLRKQIVEKYGLLAIFAIGVLLSSTYFLTLIGGIPLIQSVLRWPSSKLWPAIVIPIWIIAAEALPTFVDEISIKFKSLTKLLILLVLLFPLFPWFFPKTIPAKETYVIMPEEYLELKMLTKGSKLFVIPESQTAFFRYYKWGYYGTDFIKFLTLAEVIDGTRTINESSSNYLENYSIQTNVPCYVLYDKTVPTNKNYNAVTNGLEVVLDTESYTLYTTTNDR